MKLDNKTYDVLAFIGRVVLPALSVLYATLGEIWHLPYTKEIPLTITAFDLFLNTLLGISSNNYYKETLNNHSTKTSVTDNSALVPTKIVAYY